MRHELLRTVGPTFLAKAAAIPVVALAVIVTMRTLIGSVGTETYGFIALIIVLPMLLPFADLGLGADVSSSAARSREELCWVLARALRRLSIAAVAAAAAAGLLASMGVWSYVFGFPHQPQLEAAAAVGLALFALGVPASLGYRLLFGLDRYPLVVALQSASPIANMCAALLMVQVGVANPVLLIVVFMSTPIVASCVALRVGLRTARVTFGDLAGVSRCGAFKEVTPRSISVPMVCVMVTLAIVYQSHRLVVSHVEGLSAVVVYSAMAALFLPANGLLQAPGHTLWPYFIRRSVAGATPGRRELWMLTAAFAGVATILGVALAAAGPALTGAMTHGEGRSPLLLSCSFGVLLVLSAGYSPLGMYLMDHSGLVFQARCLTAVATFSVPLSILLCRAWGMAGPVVASCLALASCLWLPTVFRINRMSSTPSRAAVAPREPVSMYGGNNG